MADIIINRVNSETFEYQSYSSTDENLITSFNLDTSFSSSTDYVEVSVYDENQNLIIPTPGTNNVIISDYTVKEGDILLDPSSNLQGFGLDTGTFNIVYSIYRNRLSSGQYVNYYISEISSDRTEIRLDSNEIPSDLIISSSNEFVQYRNEANYFVDFYLNFGSEGLVIANNIQLNTDEGLNPTVLIKLYEPLPNNYQIKDSLWVVEKISANQAYQVTFPTEIIVEDDFQYIQGPNYSLEVRQETATSGMPFSFNNLLESDVTSSIQQIKNLLNEKEININIDYENYANFVHFSSAKTRLENFAYKAALIESSSNQISAYLGQITSGTTGSIAYSASLATLNSEIDTIIKNFDGYEYFLYFNSGSDYSWPKQNTEPPFVLYGTGSTQALEWLGSADVTSSYYGGQALSASNYDQDNRDWLYWSIPEYLRDDPQNQRYELFTDMAGQYYDNIWVYTKDLTNKFDADNRLEFGISKDLVADAIRDFAVKLYASNFNTDDLFTAFLGLTPSGSLFPFPYMTGSLNPPTGYEYVNNLISASNDVVPLNDVQKQLYKRIYHNIPYLLKTKGTVGGIRALITSYGIPDTILRINEFGGKDKIHSQDYDLKQDVFNYAFDTGYEATNFVSSSFAQLNSLFTPGDYRAPQTVQFRFRTAGMPTASSNVASSDIRYSQSLWSNSQNGVTGSLLVLEYTGSGLTSGSYSGSIPSIYDKYGTLKFIPDLTNENISASVYLPFFDGGWWSVQMNHTGSSSTNSTGSLYSANQINGVIGFTGSDTIRGYDTTDWNNSFVANLNTSSNIITPAEVIYQPFSGSYQEYRFWNQNISQSNFYDYTANPYSDEGNGVNSTPDQLAFRAALGTELNTASRTSIHPRITGSASQITQSWDGDYSSFVISGSADRLFRTNVEDIFQDQVPSGIKNRVTDKIQVENLILPEAPYGFATPTSSLATISNTSSTTLSPFESIQQSSPLSQSYTPNVNYLEVGFSPSDQIDDDINAQIGYFNMGEYIGDPRFISASNYTYPDLDLLRNAYFEKYIKSYDIVDFVRLIKFFDNSLFKMIKDFTPARTSLSSGVIIKQHLLERNRQRPPNVTSSFQDYSGSIKSFPRDYNTGSSDFPQYSYSSGSSVYRFSGGPGGSFNKFNKICNNPFYSLNYLIIGSEVVNFTSSAAPNDGTWVLEIQGIASSSFYNRAYISITQESDTIEHVFIAQSASVAYSAETGEIVGNVDATDEYQGLNIILGDTRGANVITISEAAQLKAGMVDDLGEGDIEIVLKSENVGSNNTCDITYFSGDSHPQRYNLTQSWSESVNNSVINSLFFNQSSSQYISASYGGYDTFLHADQSEFYNGIFSGSDLTVATQSLNPQYYLNVADKTLTYQPIFYSFTEGIEGTTTAAAFSNLSNHPLKGNVWIASEQISNTDNNFLPASSGASVVKLIRINRLDVNGVEVGDYIEVGTELEFLFDNSGAGLGTTYEATSYKVTGITNYGESLILTIDDEIGNPNFVWDSFGGSENWSLKVVSNYITTASDGFEGSVSPIAPDFQQQGVFKNYQRNNQNQTIFYWNGSGSQGNFTPPADNLGFFNTGSSTNFRTASNLDSWNRTGTYILDRIPNIPLFFSASFQMYGDINTDVGGTITSDPTTLHKSASYEGAGLIDQSFTISTAGAGSFIPAPKEVTANMNASFYDQDYNTQIPGNMSGSEGQIGGHPKIANGGTGSLDFYFPSLRLDGTVPALTPGNINYAPLSASAIDYSAANNQNFEGTIGLTSGWSWGEWNESGQYGSGNSQTRDGALWFSWTGIASEWLSQAGFGYDVQNIKSFTFNVAFDITGSTPDFTASIYQVKGWGGIPNGGGPITGSWTPIMGQPKFGYQATANASSTAGRINQSGLSFTFNNPYYADGLINDFATNPGEFLRFQFKAPENFDYEFRSFSITNLTPTINWFQDAGPGDNYGTSSADNLGTAFSTTYYQPGTSNNLITNEFTASQDATADSYATCTIHALLKRTGSYAGQNYDFIITQSQALSSADISEGASFNFPDSPILNISNDIATGSGDTNTASTRNNPHDMYYIEYSMSNFSAGSIGGSAVSSVNVDFNSISDTGSQIIIENTIPFGGGGFDFSGSTRIVKGNLFTDPTSYGSEYVVSNDFSILKTTATNIGLTGSYGGPYNYGDIFSLNIAVSKSFDSDAVIGNSEVLARHGSKATSSVGLPITLDIMPSASRWAPFESAYMSSGSSVPFNRPKYGQYREPTNTQTILDTYFGVGLLPFQYYTAGQPLLNNYSLQRENTYLMDVDYNNTSGPIIPVNQALILSNSASRAAVPDSNYTSFGWTVNRYLGARSTCRLYNIYSYGDQGTFGQTPNIDLRNAYFGYFNNIQNPYPNVNNVIRLNVTQLVDDGGNALPPSLSGFSGVIFKEVFPIGGNAAIAVNSGSKELKGLEGQSSIATIGTYPSPICYSQTSSNQYTESIPLSGSGNISIYDNSGSAVAKTFYAISAMGSGSDGTTTFPSTSFSTILQPSETVTQASYNNTTTVDAPYIPNQGVFRFSSSAADATAGQDLKNPQKITMQTKFATGFIYESGGDEIMMTLSCISGSTNIPFVLEDITMDAYFLNTKVNCGSLLGSIPGVDYRQGVGVKFITPNNKQADSFYRLSRQKSNSKNQSTTPILNADNQLQFLMEDAAIKPLLTNKGVAWKGTRGGAERGGPVQALEFTIKANTGNYIFKAEDQIKWQLEGITRKPKGSGKTNIFYPSTVPTEVVEFPTNFTVNGAYDDMDGDNTASAPYWVYSQSVSQSIIEMSSSNFNEAYGSAWYQGLLPYVPGPSQYFEGGSEPENTKFDPIEYPLEIQAGDEIRFVNNENYTYTILNVTDPSENIVTNAFAERVGRVKLELDGEVPTSVNKDFFLIRRPILNANSVFINGEFPYANIITTENSASGEVLTSGILYPDFPTEYISTSASKIVTDLISQGVIEP